MAAVDGGHFAGGAPAFDDLGFCVDPFAEVGAEVAFELGRAVEDFVGEDLGGEGAAAGMFHLGGDIAGERFRGIDAGLDGIAHGEPDLEHVFQHALVDRLLGAEIVMQVGFGQAGALGDLGGAGAGEAGLGEDLFGRLQEPRFAGGALAAGRAAVAGRVRPSGR